VAGDGRRSKAPDELSAKDFDRVAFWCHKRFPWWDRQLDELIEGCLEHHGAKGGLMADWAKTVMTWIRRHDAYNPEVSRRHKRSARTAAEQAAFNRELAESKKKSDQLGLGFDRNFRRAKGPLGGLINDAMTRAARRENEPT